MSDLLQIASVLVGLSFLFAWGLGHLNRLQVAALLVTIGAVGAIL